jgi:hypothetical protein
LLLTSFVQDQYYRKASQSLDRLGTLLDLVEPEFAARAALYARHEFGLRSISHAVAAHLARKSKKTTWVRPFISDVVRRVDDSTEILAYYFNTWGKPVPNALKRGLADSMDKFDQYQLAKYRGENHRVKLVDLVNIAHPRPVRSNAAALQALVAGTLRSTDTWESRLTAAGETEREEEKVEGKAEAWLELVRSRKIGYFALLRNLRNIIQQAPEAVPEACDMLTDPHLVKEPLVLPFRFLTAAEEIRKVTSEHTQRVLDAIDLALSISLDNVPELPGRTLIAVDVSGSMEGRNLKIATVFAAALRRATLRPGSEQAGGDIVSFSNFAVDVPTEGVETLTELADRIQNSQPHAGTNLRAVFGERVKAYQGIWSLDRNEVNYREVVRPLDKVYDRIVILSDMEAWMGWHAPTDLLDQYRKRTGADPHIFSFDVAGYGTLQFPERQVYALAGVSDKVFDIMKLLEQDREALIHTIGSIPLRGVKPPLQGAA